MHITTLLQHFQEGASAPLQMPAAAHVTDRNLPPMFTKLATDVESQEMWLPTDLDINSKYVCPPNRK